MKKKKIKILIVDDEFSSRIIINNLLMKYGECHMAVNGDEAIEACKKANADCNPYDLICLDILMPGTDGLTALKKIRKNDKKSKIIMITSVNKMQYTMASFNELCDAYMTKPVEKNKLSETLKSLGLV